jgi:hypothetical protein
MYPGKSRGTSLVEAAGQLFLIFREGLDYTFILLPGCGACYSRLNNALNPSIGSSQRDQPVYKSLQGRPEVGLLPTPRYCLYSFLL